MLLYKIVRPIITLLFKVIFRPTYIGKENIKKNSPLVLAGNHTNNLDCLLLISSTKREIHFLGKHTLLKGIKGIIFKYMGVIPVDRGALHNHESLTSAIEVLNKGHVIGIFPEGTINRTSDLIMNFKLGAVKMAKETDAYITPFVITGKYIPFKKSIKIIFLEPYLIENDDLLKENERLMNKVSIILKKERINEIN